MGYYVNFRQLLAISKQQTFTLTFMFFGLLPMTAHAEDLCIPGCIINKLNYGVSHQLPTTSGHIKSKQHSFPLRSRSTTKVFLRRNQVQKKSQHHSLLDSASCILLQQEAATYKKLSLLCAPTL